MARANYHAVVDRLEWQSAWLATTPTATCAHHGRHPGRRPFPATGTSYKPGLSFPSNSQNGQELDRRRKPVSHPPPDASPTGALKGQMAIGFPTHRRCSTILTIWANPTTDIAKTCAHRQDHSPTPPILDLTHLNRDF